MNNNISTSHRGNTKLGLRISTYSRPVGDTCSNSCVHLDQNCYAERIERIYPNTRKAYLKNLKITDWQKLRAFLLEANKIGNAVRWLQNGDLMKTDSIGRKILDVKFIQNIEKANQSIIDDGQIPPKQFMYTHSLYKRVTKLSKYLKLYASIDSINAYRKAQKCGFSLFAWNSSYRKGVDKKRMWENELGEKKIVCFEQLNIGKKKGTCSDCRFCIEPHIKLDIAFMQH